MASPEEFERRINRIAVQVAEGGDRAVRKAFLAIDQAVVTATPVDRGTARSNWLPNIDAPASEVVEAYAPGEKGSTGDANSAAAMAAASEAADKYNGETHRELHLTNNLEYIARLNEGWSKQAPALFVERGVAAGAASVQGARLLDGK